jgi:hypothetical protein
VPVPPEILEGTSVDSDKEDTDSDQDFQCDPRSTTRANTGPKNNGPVELL